MIKLKDIIEGRNMDIKRIALDMDGVLADFSRQFKEKLSDDDIWAKLITHRKTISKNKLAKAGYDDESYEVNLRNFVNDANALRQKVLASPHIDPFEVMKVEFKKKFGISPGWTLISWVGEDFWSGMKPMEGAEELIAYVKTLGIPLCVLTAGAGSKAKSGKQKWLAKHGLGDLPFTIVSAGIKKGEEAQVGDLLIDDKEENIVVFKQGGGDGIIHINTPQTIKELKEKL